MKTYPVMLNLIGRRVVVVGGGPVGRRKARGLLEAGAEVMLVAETVSESELPSGLTVVRESYRPEHLHGAAIVFACTDDRRTNARIASDARAAGLWVNAADQPADCDFFLPAVLRDGDVVLAIGTGGSAPGLAGALRDRVAAAFGERVGEFAGALNELRDELRSRVADSTRRHEIMSELAGEEAYSAFLSDGPDALRRRLRTLIDHAG